MTIMSWNLRIESWIFFGKMITWQPFFLGKAGTKQWKIHHLDGFYQEKMGIFHCYVSLPKGKLLVGPTFVKSPK